MGLKIQILENLHVMSRFPLCRVLPRSDWLTRPDQSREFLRHDGTWHHYGTHCEPYRAEVNSRSWTFRLRVSDCIGMNGRLSWMPPGHFPYAVWFPVCGDATQHTHWSTTDVDWVRKNRADKRLKRAPLLGQLRESVASVCSGNGKNWNEFCLPRGSPRARSITTPHLWNWTEVGWWGMEIYSIYSGVLFFFFFASLEEIVCVA